MRVLTVIYRIYLYKEEVLYFFFWLFFWFMEYRGDGWGFGNYLDYINKSFILENIKWLGNIRWWGKRKCDNDFVVLFW